MKKSKSKKLVIAKINYSLRRFLAAFIIFAMLATSHASFIFAEEINKLASESVENDNQNTNEQVEEIVASGSDTDIKDDDDNVEEVDNENYGTEPEEEEVPTASGSDTDKVDEELDENNIEEKNSGEEAEAEDGECNEVSTATGSDATKNDLTEKSESDDEVNIASGSDANKNNLSENNVDDDAIIASASDVDKVETIATESVAELLSASSLLSSPSFILESETDKKLLGGSFTNIKYYKLNKSTSDTYGISISGDHIIKKWSNYSWPSELKVKNAWYYFHDLNENAQTFIDMKNCGWFDSASSSDYQFKTYNYNGVAKSAQASVPLSEVTVSFDMKGHGTQVASQTFESGGLATNPGTPTATGWTFNKWCKKDTSTSFDFGVSVTSNTTIDASWSEKSYKISYDLNGGLYNGSTTKSDNYRAYTSTFTLPTTYLTKEGHVFSHWTNKSNGNTVSVLPANNENTYTVQAQWKVAIVKVNLDNKNATTNGTSVIYQKYDTGIYKEESCTNTLTSITTPKRNYYTFGGYYSGDNGTGTKYIDASGNLTSSFTTKSFMSETTLKAYWIGNTYKVTLNNQSATTAGTTEIYEKYATGFYKESACSTSMPSITKPTRTNYIFAGYFSGVNGGGTKYIDESGNVVASNTSFTGATTIYAAWKAKVHYDANGHGTAPDDTVGLIDSDVTLASMKTLPEGYTFGGWYEDSACSDGKKVGDAGDTYHITAYKIVYAKWTENEYDVTFILNNGTFDASLSTEIVNNVYKRKYTDSYTLPTDAKISRADFKFDGWYTASDFSSGKTTSVAASTELAPTLYAKWMTLVSFDARGHASNPSGEYVVDKDKLSSFPSLSATGYTVEGWYNSTTNNKWNLSSDIVTGPITLYAKWNTTLTYNANGHGTADDPSVAIENTDVSLKAIKTLPEGYTFDGWYNEEECNNKIGNVGDSYTLVTPKEVFAKWNENTYDVNFHTNGGTFKSSITTIVSDTYKRKYTETYTLPTSSDIDRTGYSLIGWYDNSGFTGTKITSVAGNNETVHDLYAKWGTTVKFDMKGHGTAIDDQGVEENGKVTKPTDPEATGYKFMGWYKDTDCTNAWDFASDTVASTTTLYALWYVEVTFDNKGHGTTLNKEYIKKNTAVTQPDTTTYPEYVIGYKTPATAEGYVYEFKGWYEDEQYTTSYNFAKLLSSTTTIYAKWVGPCAVTYNCQGHGVPTDPTDLVNVGEVVNTDSLTTKPNDLSEAGLTFGGWYTEAECTTKWDFAADKVYNTMTLYAKWTVNVSFDMKGHGSQIDTIEALVDKKISAPAEPSEDGILFKGWYKDSDLNNAWDFANDVVTGDTTLYASWKVKIKYNLKGHGDGDLTPYDDAEIKVGSAVTRPVDPSDSTKLSSGADKYTFVDWYKESDCINLFDFTTSITKETTIYAKWSGYADVTFNRNGRGSYINTTNNTDIVTVAIDDTIKNVNNPTETGFNFSGWYKDEDFNQAWSKNSDQVKGDMPLYAKWTTTVTYDNRGHGSKPSDLEIIDNKAIGTLPTITESGYTLDGWYNVSDNNKWEATTLVTGPLSLYAKWKTNITYNANGHGTAPASSTGFVGENVSLQSIAAVTGYTFKGWYKNSACDDDKKMGDAGSNYTVSTPETAFAKWEENTYDVTFDVNGGAFESSVKGITSNVYKRKYTETYTLPAKDDIKRSGYEFIGWYDTSDNKVTIVNGNTEDTKSVKAKWGSTVTYDMQGHGVKINDEFVEEGKLVTKPTDPSETGLTFKGWYKEKECTNAWNFTTDTINGDRTLYASWKVKVTYDLQGHGDGDLTPYDDVYIDIGGSATRPTINPTDSTKISGTSTDKYTFVNWYKESDCTNLFDFTSTLTKETTIYAKWDGNVNITFNRNGHGQYMNTSVTPYTDVITKTIGSTLADVDDPSDGGYEFKGWYKEDTFATLWNKDTEVIKKDETLYAKWTTLVTYDNGDHGTKPSDTEVVINNVISTLPDISTSGYVLVGWYKTYDSSTSTYSDEFVAGTTVVTAPITLYAKWKTTFTYDANGHGTAPAKEEVIASTSITLKSMAAVTGYTFDGWYKNSNCDDSVKIGNAGDRYLVKTPETAFAKWNENTYDVTFDVNGGTFESSVKGISSNVYKRKYSETYTLPEKDDIKRAGYEFVGWYDSADNKVTVVNGDTEDTKSVEARWGSTVTYDMQGYGVKIDDDFVEEGKKITKPTDPTSTGLTFMGWYKEKECTNAWDFTNDTVSGDVTLYASWKVKVIYDLQGHGDGDLSPYADAYVKIGESVTRPTANPTDSATISSGGAKYTFVDWYKEADCTNLYDFTATLTKETTIYAKWDGNVDITFVRNGHGDFMNRSVTPNTDVITKTIGGTLADVEDPSENGYTFEGWYKENTFATLWNKDTEIIKKDETLYAKWTTLVSFDNRGHGDKPSDIEIVINNVVPTLPSITESGYELEGWYKTYNSSTGAYSDKFVEGTTTVTAPITLYARWKAILKYNANGHGTVPADHTEFIGTNVTLKNMSSVTGFTFNGWYEDSACSIKAGNSGDSYELSKAITLYAKWDENEYNITFDTDGGIFKPISTISANTYKRKYTETYVLPTRDDIFKAGGFSFIGWFDGDGNKITKVLGNTETIISVTAKWGSKVTYDMKGYGEQVADDFVENGQLVTKPTDPTSNGLTFIGWYKESDCINEWDFTTDTITGDRTLYALWKVKVIFDLQGHGDGDANQYDTLINVGATATKPNPSDSTPLSSGSGYKYTFVDWYKESDCTNIWDFSTNIMTETTIYAKWDGNVDITFDRHGHGSYINTKDNSDIVTKKIGETISDIADPSESGYTFEGWYEDSAFATSWDKKNNKAKIDITLHAKWTTKVTYDNNGLGTKPSAVQVIVDKVIGTLPSLYEKGYEFDGWYDVNNVKWDATTSIVTEPITLYAKWITTITYNENGHGTAPKVATASVGERVYLPNMTTTGYTFDYWCKETSCKTKAGDVGDAYVVSKPETLYAKWTENTYSITFDTAGGVFNSNVSGIVSNVYKRKYSESYTLPVNDDIKKTGSSLVGWYDSGNKKITEVLGNTETILNVTAKWGSKVIFDTQGYGNKVSDAFVENGSVATRPTDPVADGLIFAGWYKDSVCTTEWNFAIDTVTCDTTIYALWKVEITYDLQGHGDGSNTRTEIIKLGDSVNNYTPTDSTKLSNNDPKYVFVNWYNDSDFKSLFDFSSKPNKATTLYAKWDGSVSVTFERYNLGSVINAIEGTDVMSFKIGEVLGNTHNPQNAGYTFVGWYQDEDFNTAWNNDNDKFKIDTTLYAKWTTKVKFDVKGHGTAPAAIDAVYNKIITEPTITAPSGLTFEGWYKEYDCKNRWDFATDKVKSETTLYAKWIARVTFDARGIAADPAALDVEVDSLATNPGDLTVTDYTFAGWYKDENGTKAWDFSNDKVSSNITLYARWEVNITYNCQGIVDNINVSNVRVGDLLVSPTNPSKAGFTFSGWYKDSDCTEPWNFKTDKVERKTTLYAKWLCKVFFDVSTMTGAKAPSYQEVQYNCIMTEPTVEKVYDSVNNYYCTVAGWYESYDSVHDAFSNQIDFSTFKVKEEMTLYSKWDRCYEISFEMMGHGKQIKSVYVARGNKINVPTTDLVEGYILAGWYQTNNSGKLSDKWDFNAMTVNDTLGDMILYAKWDECCVIKYDMHGHGASIDNQNVECDSYATKPTDPTTTGYDFGGWFRNYDENTKTYSNEFDFSTTKMSVAAETITLHAKWTAKTYNLILHLNDGSYNGSINDINNTYTYGIGLDLPSPTPNDKNKVFDAWYENNSASGTKYKMIGATMTGDKELYANYVSKNNSNPESKKDRTVVIYGGGGSGGGGSRGGSIPVSSVVKDNVNTPKFNTEYDPRENKYLMFVYDDHAQKKYLKNEWLELSDGGGNKKWYLYDQDGFMVTGWCWYGGRLYHFNDGNSEMKGTMDTGYSIIDGIEYKLNEEGMFVDSINKIPVVHQRVSRGEIIL